MEEKRLTVTVLNEQGLHARPCHSIVTTAQGYRSELSIRTGSRVVNGKSIIDLMTLGACVGAELELLARGADADGLLRAVAELFTRRFDED